MKPNELRLGNYVRLRDNGEIVAVERITRKKVGFFYGGDKSRGYFRKYCEIEGVPIHPDRGAGTNLFANIVTSNKYIKGVGDIEDDTRLRIFIQTSDNELYVLCPDYLHELQNIYYAMTGEELTFEI